jgi:hypothetical protein
LLQFVHPFGGQIGDTSDQRWPQSICGIREKIYKECQESRLPALIIKENSKNQDYSSSYISPKGVLQYRSDPNTTKQSENDVKQRKGRKRSKATKRKKV